jgi:arylsulfatase A-like enzyme
MKYFYLTYILLFYHTGKILSQIKEKFNVVLIYTDDHRYSAIHANGNNQIHTPNIDGIANNGMRFTNTYLMGSFTAATSVPSRACLMTGRNVFQLEKKGRSIPHDQITIGEAFKNSGYYSYMVGKWHQDRESLGRSFNSGSTIMGLGRYLTDQYRMPLWDWDADGIFHFDSAYLLTYSNDKKLIRKPLSGSEKKGPLANENVGPHTSEIFANSAIEFINSYHYKKPFFMYLAFHAPHDPRQAPLKFKEMYPEKEITLPPSYLPQHPFDNGEQVIRDEELAPWPRTPEVVKQHLSDYYSAITHLDNQIGRVIEALKENDKYENTVIVIAGDSGLGLGCHGLMGKQNLYNEDGIHVPLIISTPGYREKERVINSICYIHDIYPTICDLSGTKIPESVSGISLMPVIAGKKAEIRDYTYHVYTQNQRAYRKGSYKLIEYVRIPESENSEGVFKGSRVTQLFNVNNDPWEVLNLAYLPEYKDTLIMMRNEMVEKAKSYIDNSGKTDYENNTFWKYY